MAEHGHGHSTAAWTAVTILLVAAFLLSLSVVVQSWLLAIIGLVLIVVGVVSGKVLADGRLRPDQAREPARHDRRPLSSS